MKKLSLLILAFALATQVFYLAKAVENNVVPPEPIADLLKNPFAKNKPKSSTNVLLVSRQISEPYVLIINDTKYYLVFDAPNKTFTPQSMLGFQDKKTNLFESLLALESDGDVSKITAEELKKANIRLVKLLPSGKLAFYDDSQDFPLAKFGYIDCETIRATLKSDSNASSRTFDAYIKSGPQLVKVVGQVTIEDEKELKQHI